jgi:hypothetical protein
MLFLAHSLVGFFFFLGGGTTKARTLCCQAKLLFLAGHGKKRATSYVFYALFGSLSSWFPLQAKAIVDKS